MRIDITDKIRRYLISFICCIAYFVLVSALLASAHRTNLRNILLG